MSNLEEPIRWVSQPSEEDGRRQSLNLLSELLADFESVIEGDCHTVTLTRYLTDQWQLQYSCYPEEGPQIFGYTYFKTLSDFIIKARHLELMKRFQKEQEK